MKIIKHILTGVLLLTLFFLGSLAIVLAYNELNVNTANLFPTPALIVSRDEHEYSCNSTGKVGGVCRYIQVQFSYSMNGTTYTSTPKLIEEDMDSYMEGNEVTVYINPENPEELYLEPFESNKTGFWLSIFGFFCLSGLVYSLTSRR